MPHSGLGWTQRWMQAAILAPRPIKAAEAGRIILPSAAMESVERLEIYRGMYEARLEEALEADYPGVRDFLGEERFAELAQLYIREHPSRSFTLNDLGDRLPEFIRDEVDGLPRSAFLHDLARLELARTHVFDGEETPAIGPEQMACVPAEAWPGARIRPIAALRLVALRYPAHLYLEAVREDKRRPPMRRKNTWLVVYRRDYAVMWLEVERRAFQVLEALATGKTLAEALLAGRMTGPRGRTRLFRWFQAWTAEGLFQRVEA